MRVRRVPLATVEWLGTERVKFSWFGHDDVSPSLPCHTPAQALKVTHSLCAAQNGQLRHYSATSTCCVSTVKGMPDSARTSKQSSMASRMFAKASSFVSPWLTHPGMEGHSATQTPSSSRSIVTVIFIARTPVARPSPLTKALLCDALPTFSCNTNAVGLSKRSRNSTIVSALSGEATEYERMKGPT